VPRWCEDAAIQINRKTLEIQARPLSFIVIDRMWQRGDTLVLRVPMNVSVRTWAKNQNAVSVHYGPLSFSLAIKERWESFGERLRGWPQWQVFPESPWNYGLVLDSSDPARSFEVMRHEGSLPAQPFTQETVPVLLHVQARRIPQWRVDQLNVVGRLQPSPARTTEPEERITLIPMGAARLRISCFPTASTSPDAHEWVAASQ
jgi:hypothetical protein